MQRSNPKLTLKRVLLVGLLAWTPVGLTGCQVIGPLFQMLAKAFSGKIGATAGKTATKTGSLSTLGKTPTKTAAAPKSPLKLSLRGGTCPNGVCSGGPGSYKSGVPGQGS